MKMTALCAYSYNLNKTSTCIFFQVFATKDLGFVDDNHSFSQVLIEVLFPYLFSTVGQSSMYEFDFGERFSILPTKYTLQHGYTAQVRSMVVH